MNDDPLFVLGVSVMLEQFAADVEQMGSLGDEATTAAFQTKSPGLRLGRR